MAEKKVTGKSTILLVVVLVLAAAIFFAAYMLLRDKPVEGSKTISVEIVFADGTGRTEQIKTDAEYLKQALDERKLISGEEGSFGFFVTAVDGVEADPDNQEWWCLTKGGEWVLTGVSETPIMDGDHFELTLTVGY